MTAYLAKLWRGEVGLAQTFWEYAILYGTLVNLITTGASFAVIASDGPAWIALALFLLPIPYNAFVVVAVWRSAARHGGDPSWANAARIAVLVWAVIASVA